MPGKRHGIVSSHAHRGRRGHRWHHDPEEGSVEQTASHGRGGHHGPHGHGGPRGHGRHGLHSGRKLSAADLQLILLAQLAGRPAHGYELIKALEERSHGLYVPSPGAIYPALTYLEEIGYASVELDGSKKRYSLTEEGRRHYEQSREAAVRILSDMERIGAQMAQARQAVERGEVPEGTEYGATSEELEAARRELRRAQRKEGAYTEEEARRVAEVLKRAAAEIRGIFVVALLCLAGTMWCPVSTSSAQTPPVQAGDPQAQAATAKIVKAANAFLATLSDPQRKRVLFAFDDEQQRARWSNFPTSFVRRAGLSLGELSVPQRTAAMALVSSALSRRGFEKVQQIMEGDETLKKNEGNNPIFGKDLFYISLLGAPSEKEPWMLQFGGHHLAINLTIRGAQGVLTPTLTAAQPAIYTLNGKSVRPLGQESDKGIALLNALDENQRKQAILNYHVGDLVRGPGQDGKTILPEGLKVSAMNEKQRAMLLDLISEWACLVHDSAAAARLAEIKAGLNDTWFAWSGPTTVQAGSNITAYYRIQGPKLVIEYAPQRLGGEISQHVHTIYRDPTNDYGRGAAK